MVATIMSVSPSGFNGTPVLVETDIRNGLPTMQIVGMGNKSILEARERVKSSIINSKLELPAKKITINLAPAELPKDGAHLDLPIALSILVASGQIKQYEVANHLFIGELALDGSLRPTRGSILAAEVALTQGIDTIFAPRQNIAQINLIKGIKALPADSLIQVFQHLKRLRLIQQTNQTTISQSSTKRHPIEEPAHTIDDITGQDYAKRAVAISAAGKHNILLSGPPGSGKTMLINTLSSLMPKLDVKSAIEVTKIHSLGHSINSEVILDAPFRNPHHSSTLTSIIGGGAKALPGEISLAHKGVLILDELPEFPRKILESLRQPLEDKKVLISRDRIKTSYPADFLLAATMNPCPCGNLGSDDTECTCTSYQIQQYQSKISGPLLDRIDIKIDIRKSSFEQILSSSTSNIMSQKTQHSKVLGSIIGATKAQAVRYKSSYFNNGNIDTKQINLLFEIDEKALGLAALSAKSLKLSTRGYQRALRVARTIADLDGSYQVKALHVAEALQFRNTLASPP